MNDLASAKAIAQTLGGSSFGVHGLPASDLALALTPAAWRDAFLIRAFEERLLKLFAEGRLFGTVHTCIGQELSGVAFAQSLIAGDLIYSNHRCHGHYLARTGDVDGLMAEIMGREAGICGGRGGSQHICAGGVFSNGVQGGIMPVSAGLSLVQKLNGSGNIVVVYIGDGTLGQGAVYETFNLISKWQLPMLVVLDNNSYAQSTHQSQTLAGGITERAEAFGIQTLHGNIWEPGELMNLAAQAVASVRQNCQPLFFQLDSYRLMAHSKGDDNRDPAEVKRFWAMDPLTRFAEQYPEESRLMREEAEQRISLGVERADQSPYTSVESPLPPAVSEPVWRRLPVAGSERLVNRIYAGLKRNMERDSRVFCMGEDIEGPYGGAFKVTKDLSELFPGRVRNTPISEAAIVGLATGMAMGGHLPVCEIMFGDFLTLAADQLINHASKFRFMYRDQVRVPVILRAAMGGKRGYGATHSQCLEKHFLGIPDTRVLALHHHYDPALVFDSLFAHPELPTLLIENKILYGEYLSDRAPEGFVWEHTDEDFPTSRLTCRTEPDVTIVCYGGMLLDAERAVNQLFEEHEIIAEVVCPLQIYPLSLEPILESVRRTRRLLVVEEGQSFCGFGAELLAAVHTAAPGLLQWSARLGPSPHAIPCCKPAEMKSLPTVESIVQYLAGALTRE